MKFAIDGHRAGILHQLAEQGAEQKNREELHDELRRARHEGLRPMRKQRLAGQGGREDRGGRREQEHAPAAVGEPDQQPERDEDAEEPHAVRSLEQNVEIERRALAEIHRVRVQKRLRGFSPLVAQEGEERPFRVELRGRAEFGHDRVL